MANIGGSVILHSFYFSSCSWRVRAALHFKQIPFSERNVDIAVKEENLTQDFLKMSPTQKVPVLQIDNETLTESLSILQYLDHTRPRPPLQPSAPLLRARAWQISEVIASGIQPLQNIGLRRQLKPELFAEFCRNNTLRGLDTLETLLVQSAGSCCVGDDISVADLCFVPQMYNAVKRLTLDLSPYKTVSRLYNALKQEELFVATHPIKVQEKDVARRSR